MNSRGAKNVQGRPERAIIHTLHANGKWTKSSTEVAIEKKPFAEGSFRLAYMSKLLREGRWQKFVCKRAKDKKTPKSLYFKDIEAQVFATVWAQKYNATDPPKRVEFAPCFVLELVDRPGRPVCGAEVYISGAFMKHNNNVGAVCNNGNADPEVVMDRKTAQAFSHFTYDASQGQILICDIQGVGGIYTDPQIHTVNGQGFGSGNLGQTGIRAFLLRHKCNEVCREVGLNPIHAKELASSKVESKKSNFNFSTLGEKPMGHTRAKSSNLSDIASKMKQQSGQGRVPSIWQGPGHSRAESRTFDFAEKSATEVETYGRGAESKNNRPRIEKSKATKAEAKTSSSKVGLGSTDELKTKRSDSLIDEADERLMASILNGLNMSP